MVKPIAILFCFSTLFIVSCNKDAAVNPTSQQPSVGQAGPVADLLSSVAAQKHTMCVNGVQFSINRKNSGSDDWPLYRKFQDVARSRKSMDEILSYVSPTDGSQNTIKELLYSRPNTYDLVNIISVSEDVYLWGDHQFREVSYDYKQKTMKLQRSAHCTSGRCSVSNFPKNLDNSNLIDQVTGENPSSCQLSNPRSFEIFADNSIVNPITVSLEQSAFRIQDNSWKDAFLNACSNSTTNPPCDSSDYSSYRIEGNRIVDSMADFGITKSYLRDGEIRKSYEVSLGEKRFLLAHLVDKEGNDRVFMWQYGESGNLLAERSTEWELDETVFRQRAVLDSFFEFSTPNKVQVASQKVSSFKAPAHQSGKRNYFEGENSDFNFKHTFSTWDNESKTLKSYHTLTELLPSEKSRIANGEDAFFIIVVKEPPQNGTWSAYPYVWTEIEFKSEVISKENISQLKLGSVGLEQGSSYSFAEIGNSSVKHVSFDGAQSSFQYSGQQILSGEAYSWNFDY